ncbi:hypothetical protein DB347_24800 [Opitutaceae bacterium EW11]|nr:hypothetical protein DB347_24800 [Opitutaceae bacterium EW11]
MDIHALTKEELPEAQALAASLFPWEDEHQDALVAAVSHGQSGGFLAARGLSEVRAWAAKEEERVIGLLSLYDYGQTPDETWLAWYGVSTEVRGRGLGCQLLDWVIATAKRERKAVLRLWTTVEEEYAVALRLYAQRGFRPELQPALPGEDWETVVLSLGLDGKVPTSWSARSKGIPLCGRIVPAVAA